MSKVASLAYMYHMTDATYEDFWSQVYNNETKEKTKDLCWFYLGDPTNEIVYIGDRVRAANRYVWEHRYPDKPTPKPGRLLSRCRNTSCVNPAHLFVPRTPLEFAKHWADEFWSRVDKGEPDECWNFQNETSKNPVFKDLLVHRVAWMLTNKSDIPKGTTVLRRPCRNTLCCNPNHLKLGNKSTDVTRGIEDKSRKTPNKLTPEDVRNIRKEITQYTNHRIAKARSHLTMSGRINRERKVVKTPGYSIYSICSDIAQRYGVSTYTIYSIHRGFTWAWVD